MISQGTGAIINIILDPISNFGLEKYSLTIPLIRQVIVLLPVAYFMAHTGNLNLVWWAYSISEAVSVIICIFFLRMVTGNLINRLEGDDEQKVERKSEENPNKPIAEAKKY